MYHAFFGLTEPAFSIAVNPRYLYMSQQHKEALAHLLYGVEGGGFVMLTGEVGTGKTTIIRCLLEQMPANTDIAIIMNPMSNVPELLTTICEELNTSYIDDQPTIKSLTDTLHQFLLDNHTQGRNTVLLIDEAQLLSIQALEQIRLLTNLETTTQKLLHIILVGQPELKDLLAKPELRQLSQRITARFHLAPLNLEETLAYIQHRLKIAGLPEGRGPFPFALIKRIHAFTGGIPRLINVICERCLIGAYANNQHKVDNNIFNAARKEVLGGLHQDKKNKYHPYWKAAAIVFFLLCALSVVYNFLNRTPVATTAQVASPIASSSSEIFTVTTNTDMQTKAINDSFFRNYKTAEDAYFNYLGFALNPEARPCGQKLNNLECQKISLHTWKDITEVNRPAILFMTTPDKFSTYLVVIGLTAENALIINEQQQRVVLPLTSLGRNWTGEIVYLWKRPPSFSEPLTLGDSSPTVEWLAQQFAKLDKQKEPLTNDVFSLALQERVKIFQQTYNLTINGSIDEQTLMKVNEALGIDNTLLTDF